MTKSYTAARSDEYPNLLKEIVHACVRKLLSSRSLIMTFVSHLLLMIALCCIRADWPTQYMKMGVGAIMTQKNTNSPVSIGAPVSILQRLF